MFLVFVFLVSMTVITVPVFLVIRLMMSLIIMAVMTCCFYLGQPQEQQKDCCYSKQTSDIDEWKS